MVLYECYRQQIDGALWVLSKVRCEKKNVGRVVGKIKKRAHVTFWRAKPLGISINNEIIKRRKIGVMQGRRWAISFLRPTFKNGLQRSYCLSCHTCCSHGAVLSNHMYFTSKYIITDFDNQKLSYQIKRRDNSKQNEQVKDSPSKK